MIFKANPLKMLKTNKKLTISTNRLNRTQTLNSNEAKRREVTVFQRFELAQQSFRNDV